VFGLVERVVAVGAEVLREVDRQLVERVALEISVGASMANGDGRVVVEVVRVPLGAVAVANVRLDDWRERRAGHSPVDEDRHMAV